MSSQSLVHPTARATVQRRRAEHISSALPFIADLKGGTSHASWKVWSGSTTKDARFAPIPKKVAIRIYHKAVEWNRRSKTPGCHGGVIGSHVLLVLHSLIFDFLNHRTGRLDPSYNALQRSTRLCRQTIATALARLKQLGIINWVRRCYEDWDDLGRFILRQDTNAYAILPPTQWRSYMDVDVPQPPHPSSWGAAPPLPSLVEQAVESREAGVSMRSVVEHLADDPRDPQLAREAKAIVALAFRNGPIESVHAGKLCPTCSAGPEYSRITDDEMKAIMKSAVNRVYALLRRKKIDPEGYAREITFGERYVAQWDEPEEVGSGSASRK